MTKEEIAKIMNLSLEQLANLCGCNDLAELANIISCAVNMGINIGQGRVGKQYNQMFRSYDKISIEN